MTAGMHQNNTKTIEKRTEKKWITKQILYAFHTLNKTYISALLLTELQYTVDSRYLEIEGTLKISSRYPYFDISDL